MPEQPVAAAGVRPWVLCFGEALVDRLGPPGGDPALPPSPDHPVEERLGGAPANVALALARLGTPTAFLGRIGEDASGAAFAALCDERGVDSSALQWDNVRPTRTVLVRRDAGGERQFGGFAGERGRGFADQAVAAGALIEALDPLWAQARWLLTGTLALASSASAAALEQLLEAAASHGVPLALDVNWRPTFWGLGPDAGPPPAVQQRLRPLLEQAALIKCAVEEAEGLFFSRDPLAIRSALPRQPAVLITAGRDPVHWCLGGLSGTQPAFNVEVVDTTGAGDAFMAGVLHGLCRQPGLLHGRSPIEADGEAGRGQDGAIANCGNAEELLRFASACGALTCRDAGAIDPQPTALEVAAFLGKQVAAPRGM